MKNVFYRHKPVPTVKRPNNNYRIRQNKRRSFALLLNSRRLRERLVN